MIWVLFAVLILAGILLLVQQLHQQQAKQLITDRLTNRPRTRTNQRIGQHLKVFGSQSWVKRYLNIDWETQVLLRRAGLEGTLQQTLFFISQLLVPVLLVFAAVLIHNTRSEPFSHPIVVYLLAAGMGYLLPKRLLAQLAKRRQSRLVEEVSTFVPLLRILFSAGLTVEQSLRILSQQGDRVMPLLASRIRAVIQRVDSGLSLSDELQDIAKQLEIDELTDCMAVLRQLLLQGGGAMKSLQDLKQLMDDRRLTRLQEKISKMSAKMSIVMMIFLFPALLIVLAGPGMTALGRAMGGM